MLAALSNGHTLSVLLEHSTHHIVDRHTEGLNRVQKPQLYQLYQAFDYKPLFLFCAAACLCAYRLSRTLLLFCKILEFAHGCYMTAWSRHKRSSVI